MDSEYKNRVLSITYTGLKQDPLDMYILIVGPGDKRTKQRHNEALQLVYFFPPA